MTAVVVHTTGGGIIDRALRKGADPLQHAAEYYARPDAYASHYLVGYGGEIISTVAEDRVAYHAGVGRAHLEVYRKGRAIWPRYVIEGGVLAMRDRPQPHYDDWLTRWPDRAGPHELVPPPGVNTRTVGVDLLAPGYREGHPDAQVITAAALVRDILRRKSLLPSRMTVLRHADVAPFSRSTKRGGWDPPRPAFEALCRHLGFEAWPEFVA